MGTDSSELFFVNASHFVRVARYHECVVYSSKSQDVIALLSFEDALHPNTYRSLFHPFAYVILNTYSNELVLVRDHLGIRPLYYYYQSGQFIFGDTISDIIHQLPQAPDLLDTEVAHLFGDFHRYTDNTLYKNIYRVEPGHMVYFKAGGGIIKSAFWQLEQEGNTLYYPDDQAYLEHFTSLMQESIKNATKSVSSIAAEFSAGMDSTAIYGTCASLGLNPALFMHEPPTDSMNKQTYNARYEKAFLAQYPSAMLHRIRPSDFDAIRVLQDYTQWFSGPPPYVFELFAAPLHQAVSKAGHQILLSGFGGDQGVSSHVPARFIIPELIHHKRFGQAWLEAAPVSSTRRLMLLLQYAHPVLHQFMQKIQDSFRKSNQKKLISTHPYHRHYFKTLRELEWSFLQGPNSHEIRMRVEYSSIVAQKMGFEYRYPLLYPKLLEFFISLPIEQKRHQGVGRYLMRRYLANSLPTAPFDTYRKREGLNIIPTLDTFKAQWERGVFQDELEKLPFKHLTQDQSPHKAMIKNIQAFMLNEYLNH